jgi:hypothetical protein
MMRLRELGKIMEMTRTRMLSSVPDSLVAENWGYPRFQYSCALG